MAQLSDYDSTVKLLLPALQLRDIFVFHSDVDLLLCLLFV